MDSEQQMKSIKQIIEKIDNFSKLHYSFKNLRFLSKENQTVQLKFQNSFLEHEKSTTRTQFLQIKDQEDQATLLTENCQTEVLPYYSTQSDNLRNVIEWYQEKKDNKSTHHFKIIRDNKCVEIINTTEFFEHLFIEDQFGELKWNKDQTKVVFVAEKKQQDEQKISNIIKDLNKKDLLEKYMSQNNKYHGYARYTDHRHSPIIFILDIKQFKLYKYDLEPKQNIIPLEPFFDQDDNILFPAITKENFQYSIVYCYNRPKCLYRLKKQSVKELNGKKLEQEEKKEEDKKEELFVPEKIGFDDFFTLLNPFFDKDYKNLFFIGRKDRFYEHKTYFQLWKFDYVNYNGSNPQLELLIDKECEDQEGFNGIVNVFQNNSILDKIFCTNNMNEIFINTIYKGITKIGLYDIEKKQFKQIPQFSDQDTNYVLLQRNEDDIFVEEQSNTQLQKIYHYNLKSEQKKLLYKLDVEQEEGEAKNLLEQFQNYETERIQLDNSAEGFIIFSNKNKKGPLLTKIHGGPFSFSQMNKNFILSHSLYLDMGINLLIVNYRGSLSYGYKNMQQLIGKAGIIDVQDCIDLINKSFNKYSQILDKDKLIIMGGSHGGFLTGWLSCHEQFSKQIKCSIMINSVVYGPSLLSGSNIPDWTFATLQTNQREIEWPISDKNLLNIYNSTCIKQIKNVKCPILIISGEKDKCVPEDNNKYFYHTLKKYRNDCEFINYKNDNHQMNNKETQYHYILNILDFLIRKIIQIIIQINHGQIFINNIVYQQV